MWGTGSVATVAGNGDQDFKNGQATEASFNQPWAVAVDPSGQLLVTDEGNHCVRCIDLRGGVSTYAGTAQLAGFRDGSASQAAFYYPMGLAVAEDGTVLVADHWNNRIRKITPQGKVSTVTGSGSRGFRDGSLAEACFYYPWGLALDGSGSIIVADWGNHRIRRVTPQGVTTLAGDGQKGNKDGPALEASFKYPLAMAVGPNGHVMATDDNGRLCLIFEGRVSTVATGLNDPRGLLVDCRGNAIVADAGNNRIVFISTSKCFQNTNSVALEGEVIAGNGQEDFKDGPSGEASFNRPSGLALDHQGRVVVADYDNNRVRALSLPSTKRLQSELQSLSSSSSSSAVPAGCSVTRSAKSLFKWSAVFRVAEGSIQGGLFELSLEMPFDYPASGPLVKFVSFLAHPNVDSVSGEVSYGEWSGGDDDEKKSSNILGVLETLRTMLPSMEELLVRQVSLAEQALALMEPKGRFELQFAYDRRMAQPRRALEAAKANLEALHKSKTAATISCPNAADGSVEFWSRKLEGVLDPSDLAEAASKLSAAGIKQRHWGELSKDELKEFGLKHGVVKDLMKHQTENSSVPPPTPFGVAEEEAKFDMASFPAHVAKIRQTELAMGAVLGSGSFSEVRQAVWTRTIAVGRQQVSKVAVAVKTPIRNNNNHNNNNKNEREALLADMARDSAVLSSLPHQNLVTLYGVMVAEGLIEEVSMSLQVKGLVYELMATDLSKLLKQSPSKRLGSHKLLLRVLRDVACGLAHLHDHGVLHRDVKPHNVLLRGEQFEQVKLCDFGSSRDLQQSIQQMTRVGVTWDYMAPEVFNKEPYGKPADVWSFGVLLFQCVTGEVCAPRADSQLLKAQLEAAGCGSELIALFEQCHKADEPFERPSMRAIYDTLQRLVMQASADDDELRQELKRAQEQDRDTYEKAWQGIVSANHMMQELLDCAKQLAAHTKHNVVRQPLLTLQGKGSMEELEELASAELCESLHSTMQSMVEACGGTYLRANRKSRERCVQKVGKDYKGDFSKLLDVERGTGLFTNSKGMLECLKLFQQTLVGAQQGQQDKQKTVQLLRCKDRLNSPLESGYRDLLLNVKCASFTQQQGQQRQQQGEKLFVVAELQLNFPEVAEIKSHSHRFFELVRVMQLPWVQ